MTDQVAREALRQLSARLLELIGERTGGVTIAHIEKSLNYTVARRTLQRRLRELVEKGAVVTSGSTRARIYHLAARQPTSKNASHAEFLESQDYASLIPLSKSSERTLAQIRQPIQKRTPIGYKRQFLESYIPNTTTYLSRETQQYLLKIGRPAVGERPAGTYARDILSRFLIDLSWASSHLEGNTYSRLDTQNLIEFGQVAEGKDRTEAQMILNHKQAVEFLVDNAEEVDFNLYTLCNLHALLSENLLADPNEGGCIRQRIVNISGTTFHPLAIPQQLEENFRLLLEKATQIDNSLEQAFFIMVQLPYLQPFIDVNKRVSRVAANIPFIKENLCPLSFVDVPEQAYIQGLLAVYELQRVDLFVDIFVWAYERSCKRYLVIKETVAEPDIVRQQYRDEFRGVVAEIVRRKQRPTRLAVATAIEGLIPKKDQQRFIELALADLRNLHIGNVSRFRLRLSEFRAWEPIRNGARGDMKV